jgi:hypothetical protein
MDRTELAALRDALSVVLEWPDSIRSEIARWLTAEAAPKPGNGLDPHPPRAAQTTGGAAPTSFRRKAPPNNTFTRKTIELKVLASLRDSPNQSASALARSVGGAHTTVGRELQRLAFRGEIEKGADGLWRLAGAKPDPTSAPLSS